MGATRTKVNLVLSIVSFVFLLGGYFTDYWLSVGGILDMHSGLHKACFFGICIKMSTILDSLEECKYYYNTSRPNYARDFKGPKLSPIPNGINGKKLRLGIFHSVNTHKLHGDILLQFNGNSMCND